MFNKSKIINLLYIYLIIITIFSIIYYYVGAHNFHNMKNSYLDSLYFSIITSSTVGYGDITPKTNTAKIIVILQIILSYTNIGILFLS